jgi:hypothetical protein
MPAMVMNAPPNGSNGVDTSTSGARHNSMLQKSVPMRRRSRSKGTISGFGSSNDHSHDNSQSDVPPAPPNLSADSISGSKDSSNQPQHAGDSTAPHPPPIKPSHSAKMALVCVQNASYMGARTQINLCPPGKARDDLLKALQARRRKKKTLPAPTPIRRSLSFQRTASINSVGSRAEEVSGFEKVLGESGVAEYGHEEDKFLNNPDLRSGDLNSDGEEIQEDPSSGDNDELSFLFDDEDARSKGGDDNNSDRDCTEPLYLCGNEAVSDVRGSANSGKIAFNFRKVKWFDAVTATDRATARKYLRKEIQSLKKRDIKALTNHLKKVQRREKRRMEMENGRRSRTGSISDRLFNDENDDESSHQLSGIGKLPSPMTPSLSAALVLESLSLNPLESIEGISKCYEGIVAAGSAILESKIDEPNAEKKKHSKDQIMNALTPLLITTLEQASGDTLLALAKLRKSCGTKRYQRRFVQRIAPSLIRPPNAAMWCLRHQQDMESIIAATELILDKSSDVFRKEWYERGRTILADSKRAETLKVAATQLKNLSAPQPSDRLMKGFPSQKGSHHRRSRSGSFFQKSSKDHNGLASTDVMAEWEILAVDRQIRDSIHNLFTRDWQRVVVTNAPARDGEPSHSKKPRGISAGKTKPSLSEIDTNSASPADQSQFVTSPPRMSHNRMLPSTNPVPFAPSPGSRGSSTPQESSPGYKGDSQREPYDPTTPPHTPRTNNENEFITTPPRSPPHSQSYQHSPRNNPISPKYMDSTNMPSSPVETSRTPAPLSPVNSYRRQHESSHQRFASSSAGSSPNAQSLYLRTLTSTAAERKRTVAACRALRAQIARFEEAFIKMHGRPPKGAAERAPLATTYAQYREWKRAIRADAASRIQALARGASVRSYLVQNPKFKEIVRKRAGRPKKISYSHLSIPENIENEQAPKMQPQPIAPMPRRDDGSVEIVMGPASAWPRRSTSDLSYDNSTLNGSQYPSTGSATSSFKLEIAHFSHAELQSQKRELKQELKKYDMSFFNQHGRMPVKAEKEPIRHLYEKYNQLKNRITAVERDPSLIQQSVPGPRRKSVTLPSHKNNNSNNNSSSEDSPTSTPSGQSRSTRSDSYKRQTSPTGPSSGQDLGALKTEKHALHQMLRSYEKEFYKKYNRQVSSYADIRPVASQYRRYKEIKKLIVALQPAGDQ